jgi:hypothetical protein
MWLVSEHINSGKEEKQNQHFFSTEEEAKEFYGKGDTGTDKHVSN